MRYVIFLGLAAAGGILIRLKSEYRYRILGVLAAIIVALNVYYNAGTFKDVMSFISPVNQTFYQTDFLESEEYPDALLMPLFKDKTVRAKNDIYTIEEAEGEGKDFMYSYYHAKNIHRFIKAAGGTLQKDDGLNDVNLSTKAVADDFAPLGIANDMFRYMFMYNDGTDWTDNYFSYYWYYNEHLSPIKAYLCDKKDSSGHTVFDSDDLVVMWNTSADREEEDIYIMTGGYYDDIAGTDAVVRGKGREVSVDE